MEIITQPHEYLMEFCNVANVTPLYMLSRKRDSDRYIKRQLYSYFGWKYLGFKKINLSSAIGQDHTTCIHSIKKIQGLITVGDSLTINSIEHLKLHFEISESGKVETLENKYDELLVWSLGIKAENKRILKENKYLKLQLLNQKITA